MIGRQTFDRLPAFCLSNQSFVLNISSKKQVFFIFQRNGREKRYNYLNDSLK